MYIFCNTSHILNKVSIFIHLIICYRHTHRVLGLFVHLGFLANRSNIFVCLLYEITVNLTNLGLTECDTTDKLSTKSYNIVMDVGPHQSLKCPAHEHQFSKVYNRDKEMDHFLICMLVVIRQGTEICYLCVIACEPVNIEAVLLTEDDHKL